MKMITTFVEIISPLKYAVSLFTKATILQIINDSKRKINGNIVIKTYF